MPGLQTLLPMMLASSLAGDFALIRPVDVLATTPARLFGLFPSKGRIAPGADADLIVVSGAVRQTVDAATLRTRARPSFAGMTGAGSIDLVLLRGHRIVECGVPAPEPRGIFLRSPVGDTGTAAPAG